MQGLRHSFKITTVDVLCKASVAACKVLKKLCYKKTMIIILPNTADFFFYIKHLHGNMEPTVARYRLICLGKKAITDKKVKKEH